MTKIIFDIENKKDYADLWDILPDWADKITKGEKKEYDVIWNTELNESYRCLIKINWHDKTEITRPIQEATDQDIGKICVFYDRFEETDDEPDVYAVLHKIENQGKNTWFYTDTGSYFAHCRRLTKQEIEELL